MNCTAIILIGMALACQCLAGGTPRELRYRAYRATDAKAEEIVKLLEGLTAKHLNLEDLALSDAVHRLQKACAPEGRAAVINFVIRYPEVQGDHDAQKSGADLKVTLRAEAIDFAAAVDRMCRKVGYRWSIEVPKETGIPVLVLAPNQANKSE